MFTGPGPTGPGPVENLVVSSVTVDSLTVGWTAPTSGVVTGYKVTLDGGNEQTPASDATTATFSTLTAGKAYVVAVVTVNDDGQSSKVEKTFYTSKYRHDRKSSIQCQICFHIKLRNRIFIKALPLNAEICFQVW